MRKLTFEGFLRRYVRELSFENTNSIYKLAHEATNENPRLREPLFLYAVFNGKVDELKSAVAHSSELQQVYSPIFSKYAERDNLRQAVVYNHDDLPNEYKKVYRSFQTLQKQPESDSHTKSLMRSKIERMKAQKGISNYRIYTDLKLNPGNFNDFMKNSKLEKMSLDKLREILEYLE